MNISEFLIARMEEGKLAAERILDEEVRNTMLLAFDHILLIIDWHQNWPILVEGEPKLETSQPTADPDFMTISMKKEIEWLTQKAYVARFGREPITAPLLRQIAQSYNWHPDYDQEWEI